MDNQNTAVVTFKEWMIIMLIMAIPIVNIIMLFVWAFGPTAKATKANFAKAALVWMAIAFVLTFITTLFT